MGIIAWGDTLNTKIVPHALTIDLDLVSVYDMYKILQQHQGYVDGDRRQLIVWCVK